MVGEQAALDPMDEARPLSFPPLPFPGPQQSRVEHLHSGVHRKRIVFCCWNTGRLSGGGREKDILDEGNLGELVKDVKVGSASGKTSEAFKVCSVGRDKASP